MAEETIKERIARLRAERGAPATAVADPTPEPEPEPEPPTVEADVPDTGSATLDERVELLELELEALSGRIAAHFGGKV